MADFKYKEVDHPEYGPTMCCFLCGGLISPNGYGPSACEVCGQRYDYKEGDMIVLSEEQVAVLRTVPPNK